MKRCDTYENWFLTQSNPCFEVWLYYHKHKSIPTLDNPDVCQNWKQLVNDSIPGGFDARRHPIYIEEGCNNAKQNFQKTGNTPDTGNTEVYKLAQAIIPLVKSKLDIALKGI